MTATRPPLASQLKCGNTWIIYAPISVNSGCLENMEFAELLAHKYHFGREHEASIQLLFRSFCNNLYIGQFELARASIKELHQQRSFLKYHVKDVFSKALDRWCTR